MLLHIILKVKSNLFTNMSCAEHFFEDSVIGIILIMKKKIFKSTVPLKVGIEKSFLMLNYCELH